MIDHAPWSYALATETTEVGQLHGAIHLAFAKGWVDDNETDDNETNNEEDDQ